MCRSQGSKDRKGGNDRCKKCAHCKKPGHTIESCFVLKRYKEGAARLVANSESGYDASEDSLVYSVTSKVFLPTFLPSFPTSN